MKKQSIIIIIAILFVLLLLFYNRFSGNWFISEQHVQATQHQVKPELDMSELGTKQPLSDITHDTSFTEPLPRLKAVDNANKGKIDYDADWCIAATDLTQQDIVYYHRELEDWNLSRGRISPPSSNGYASNKSQYLVPYMESSNDDLWKQIQVDNEYAMIAALGRRDIDIENQRKIAHRLVVKGHTGAALSHLVLIELSNAEMIYKQTGLINADIEESIYKARAYASYGIKRFDLGAASTYLITVSSADFPLELKRHYALDKDNRINEYTHALEEFIDKARTHENVMVTAPEEQPKAVKHDFENTLAHLYREYGYELSAFKSTLPNTVGAMLESSECVQRQVEFINNLEQGRKARQGVR